MTEALIALLAALLGAVLDRLRQWHVQKAAFRNAQDRQQRQERLEIERINARIDRHIAETPLSDLISRL